MLLLQPRPNYLHWLLLHCTLAEYCRSMLGAYTAALNYQKAKCTNYCSMLHCSVPCAQHCIAVDCVLHYFEYFAYFSDLHFAVRHCCRIVLVLVHCSVVLRHFALFQWVEVAVLLCYTTALCIVTVGWSNLCSAASSRHQHKGRLWLELSSQQGKW